MIFHHFSNCNWAKDQSINCCPFLHWFSQKKQFLDMFATFSFKIWSLTNPPRNYLPRTREKTPWIVRLCRCERCAEPQVSLFQYSEKWWSLYFTIQFSTRSHTCSAKVPWNKSLNLMCPIKYAMPKRSKVSHWLSQHKKPRIYILPKSNSSTRKVMMAKERPWNMRGVINQQNLT